MRLMRDFWNVLYLTVIHMKLLLFQQAKGPLTPEKRTKNIFRTSMSNVPDPTLQVFCT